MLKIKPIINLLVISFTLILPSFAEVVPNFRKIESLAEISLEQPEGTIFFFNIGDTIIDTPHMVGSRAWRKYVGPVSQKIDASVNWHDILTFDLAKDYPHRAVEGITSSFIYELQTRGYVVNGLTGRERQIWYDMPQDGVDHVTVKQLRSVNVDFNNYSLENTYPELAQAPEYYGGIFFANIEPKSEYLLKLLSNTSHLPKKIVMIDDKESQVEASALVLTSLGIEHEVYTYTGTQKRAKSFNPLWANIELFHFYLSDATEILSDEQAAVIAKQNPDQDADYYLKASIDLARLKRLRSDKLTPEFPEMPPLPEEIPFPEVPPYPKAPELPEHPLK